MRPPREWAERWARENPRQALAVLAFGVAQGVFIVWLIVSDGCRP